MRMDRRRFVSSAAAGFVGASVSVRGAGRAVQGAGDRITLGLIGCGGMGRSNLQNFLKMRDAQVAAVCDVYEFNRNRALKMAEDQKGAGPVAAVDDFRRVLDRKDIDAVIVATPDHWHAIPTILACEAGKDVYVEKPISHNIVEGRRMVQAVEKHKRVLQMGTQQRSGPHFQEAVKLVRDGTIGKVTRVATWNYGNQSPNGAGNHPDSAPPQGLDWDFYLGPAPKVPFNTNRFLWNFRWFWDYAGGMMTDWGVHLIDIVHWAMDVKAPLAVTAAGGKYVIQDNRDTPDTLEALYEYPGFVMTYSNRVLNARGNSGKGYGIEFYGTDGTLFLDRSGYEIYPETSGALEMPQAAHLREVELYEAEQRKEWNRTRQVRKARSVAVVGEGSEQNLNHTRNFLDCVKSRQKPISDAETGHRSTSACQLANVSLRSGRKIRWNAGAETVEGDAEAARLLTREYRAPWTL
jgi:predicted dehydrogenase